MTRSRTRQQWLNNAAWLLILVFYSPGLTTGCSKSSRHDTSSVQKSQSATSASHSKVERHLLQTIADAEHLGKGNPLLLSSLYSLASYYRSQQQYTKAETQYQKALALKEELSGPHHPDIVMILNRYADLLREAKRFTEAKQLDSRADAISRKSKIPLPTKALPQS